MHPNRIVIRAAESSSLIPLLAFSSWHAGHASAATSRPKLTKHVIDLQTAYCASRLDRGPSPLRTWQIAVHGQNLALLC